MRLAEALDLAPAERETLRLRESVARYRHGGDSRRRVEQEDAAYAGRAGTDSPAPAVAAQLLEQVPALRHIAPVVRHHHDAGTAAVTRTASRTRRSLSGAGAGGGRLLWLADLRLAGAKAGSPDTAIATLRAASGTQLDPAIAQTLVGALVPAGATAAPDWFTPAHQGDSVEAVGVMDVRQQAQRQTI